MTNIFTANDFIENLNGGGLQNPLSCEGFVKPIENNREAFLFSIGTSCEEWTKISVEIIEKVEFIEKLSCRDHSHPLVRIHFKEPSPNDSFASAFASLLRGYNSTQNQLSGFKSNQKQFMQKEGDREPSWIEERVAEILWDMWRGLGRDEDTRKPTGALGRLRRCNVLRQRCRRGDQKACEQFDALDCE